MIVELTEFLGACFISQNYLNAITPIYLITRDFTFSNQPHL